MRKWTTILLLMGATWLVHGQTVVITGTVLDPTGHAYQNGSGMVKLVPQNQNWMINGTNPVNGVRPIAGLDSFGNFSIALENTSLITPQGATPQWEFNFLS